MGYTLWGCSGKFPWKKTGIEMLTGLAPSGRTEKSLLRTPWSTKPAGKLPNLISLIYNLAKFSSTKIMFANLAIWPLSTVLSGESYYGPQM